MIVADDPLAKAAETWTGRAAGPACRVCKTNLTEGHRYYQEQESVVHYCCRAREEADAREEDRLKVELEKLREMGF